MEVHDDYVKRAGEGSIDLLFLGDSLTQFWDRHLEIWDRYYAPRHAARFGIGGDSTQHLLWRLDHGEVDGIHPKVVVLLIGTNNLVSHTPAEIAEGITAIVSKLREKLPASRILLLGLFPRSASPNDPPRIRLQAVNARIAHLDDGRHVRYLDLGSHFLNADGTLSPEIMPDLLHLSGKGYRLWADAMEPTLGRMMAEK